MTPLQAERNGVVAQALDPLNSQCTTVSGADGSKDLTGLVRRGDLVLVHLVDHVPFDLEGWSQFA